jgi:surface polysaccharide O-acyltransferase-like enzyme
MTTKIRNSNFELLRIIAMIFIVIWHISIHAQKGELASHNYILAITITGVNLFVLISGYFGIKLNWKNLLTLVSTVAFYNLASIILKWQITGATPMLGEVAGSFPPLCNTHWWFINCYFILMLLSPIINIALEKATEKQYKYTLGILLFTSCISGFCFKNSINITGYNTFQFITIYVLGNAIKKFHLPSCLSTKQFACTYILSTLCIFALSFFASRISNYNNPLIVISALSLFCIFAKLEFKSKAVNYIATFMLSVYLLQDSSTGSIIYKYLYHSGQEMNFQGTEYSSLIILYIIILLGSAFILDNIRRLVLDKPTGRISNFLTKKLNIFS